MTDAARAKVQTWLEVSMRIALPILLGIAGWTHTQLLSLDRRVTTIEAQRAELTTLMAEVRAQQARNTELLQRLDERLAALQRSVQR